MDKKSRDLVMGKLYLKNKDYKMAEKSLLDHVNLSPEDFQALKMLAQVYENLNNYQKAFEFYERSYLVEPERKGTLLDICRILLIDNSGLERVDRKKWLQLAIRAFPTNPIVTSLRDTLPALESNSSPNKVDIESEVLSKLDRLEQRMAGIEEALLRLSMRKDPEPAPREELAPRQLAARESTPTPVTKEPSVFAPVTKAPEPVQNKAEPLSILPVAKAPEPVQSKAAPISFLPITKAPEPAPNKAAPLSFLPVTKDPEPATSKGPLSFFSVKNDVETTPSKETPSLFAAMKAAESSPKNDADDKSVNLFANGLKKLNLPTEGSWAATPVKTFPVFNFGVSKDSSTAAGSTPLNFAAKKENDDTGVNAGAAAPAPAFPLFNFGALKTTAASTTTTTNDTKDDNGDGDGDGDDGVVEAADLPIENTCDMQPIEIKSGEEDEDTIFEHRCKLFRFRDKEYKERGLGNMKVLKHRTTGAGRLIMRRDLVNLVCLNCWSCSKVERVRDTQVRFAGVDASDGEPVMTVFLAKFKTQELTDTFMSHLTDLFKDESD